MNDYWIERLDEARAETAAQHAKIVNFCYLIGRYGSLAERTGNADVLVLVAEMQAVVDGTWTQPE